MSRFCIFAALVLLMAIPATPTIAHGKNPGMWQVFFHNQATGEIKTGCFEILGKTDRFPHYECHDKNEGLKAFDPGKQWKPVALTRACMRGDITGTVKNCLTFRLQPAGDPQYVCHDKEAGKYVSFDPGDPWRLLPEDDPACAKRTFGPDAIRHLEFELKGATGASLTQEPDATSPDTRVVKPAEVTR